MQERTNAQFINSSSYQPFTTAKNEYRKIPVGYDGEIVNIRGRSYKRITSRVDSATAQVPLSTLIKYELSPASESSNLGTLVHGMIFEGDANSHLVSMRISSSLTPPYTYTQNQWVNGAQTQINQKVNWDFDLEIFFPSAKIIYVPLTNMPSFYRLKDKLILNINNTDAAAAHRISFSTIQTIYEELST
jgi:hypothetical protein